MKTMRIIPDLIGMFIYICIVSWILIAISKSNKEKPTRNLIIRSTILAGLAQLVLFLLSYRFFPISFISVAIYIVVTQIMVIVVILIMLVKNLISKTNI